MFHFSLVCVKFMDLTALSLMATSRLIYELRPYVRLYIVNGEYNILLVKVEVRTTYTQLIYT